MKLLLLADIPPCKNFTGGLVIDQMCRFLPPGSIACLTVLNQYVDAKLSPDLSWMPIAYTRKRHEGRVGIGTSFWSRLETILAEQLYRNLVVPRLTRQAVRFAREQKIDAIWAVLEGQTVIQMAPALAKKLKVPMFSHVWDPLSWWLSANNIDPLNSRLAQKDFDRAVGMSRGAIAASEPMAEHYRKMYGVTSLPIIASHPKSLGEPASSGLAGDTVRLGMAGQFYASEEWLLLVDSLEQVNWTIAGKPVKVIAMGPQKPPGEDLPERVEFLGWKSQPEAVKILAGCDILICPYPFSGTMREVAELSFPSKVPLYLAAGRPVLFIGPSYSSPTRYIRERGIGVAVNNPLKAAVIDGLMRLIVDTEFYASAAQSAARAFQEDFTLDTMCARFAEILGVPVKDGFLEMNAAPVSGNPVDPVTLPNVVDEDFSFAGLEKKFRLTGIMGAGRRGKRAMRTRLIPAAIHILQKFYLRAILARLARIILPYRRAYVLQCRLTATRDAALSAREQEVADLWDRIDSLRGGSHREQSGSPLKAVKNASMDKWEALARALVEESAENLQSKAVNLALGLNAKRMTLRFLPLQSLHDAVEPVLREDASGDILLAGIQRIDAPAYLSALVGDLGMRHRKVWVMTSVIEGESSAEKRRARGLPAKVIPAEELSRMVQQITKKYAPSGAAVETVDAPLEHALIYLPISRLSVLYIDGDTFESVMVILNTQYAKLSPGGLVIADRYSDAVKAAVDHFRESHHIVEHLKTVAGGGAFWHKPNPLRQAAE